MKKIFSVAVSLIVILFILGCGSGTSGTSTQDQTAQQDSGETEDLDEQTASDYENEIAEAMALGKEVKCTMKVEGMTQEMWIKNEKNIRVESSIQGQKAVMVYNDKIVYQWMEGQNTGFTFDLEKMEESAEDIQTTGIQEPQSVEDISNVAVSIDCEATSIDDSLVSKPSDIEFTDFNEYIEQMMSQMQGMEGMPPMN